MADLVQLLQQLLTAQAEQQNQFSQALQAMITPEKQNAELFSTINTQVSEFMYSPETDETFHTWYERYGPYIETDGSALPDTMKVRYETFTMRKAPSQSPLDFATQVSASCEKSKMDLTRDEVKSLIFTTGLGEEDRDLRERCLKLMEDARQKGAAIKFSALVEECRTVLTLRSSASALSHLAGGSNSVTNSISVRPQRVSERVGRQQFKSPNRSRHNSVNQHRSPATRTQPTNKHHAPPPYPCRWCKAMHWMSDCPKRPNGPNYRRPAQRGSEWRSPHRTRDGSNKRLDSMTVLSMDSDNEQWITVKCAINGNMVSLMVDTGSRLTVIQTQLWEKLGRPPLNGVKRKGRSYSGAEFEISGSFLCSVTYSGVTLELECFVTPQGILNLFGLPWIRAFEHALHRPIATTLPPEAVSSMVTAAPTNAGDLTSHLKSEFPQVFSEGLGKCTKMKAHLHLKPDATPVFCRPRPVPHGARDAVDAELDRLLKIGAIKQIDYSKWAAPIVAVKKRSGDTRVCIDFSTGLNNNIELHRHPLPLPADIFYGIRGTSVFSQIDFRDAYLQVELDDESKALVGLNTHRGLFQYQRLPFGIKSAPSIFQKLMDELVAGLQGVFVYLDDFVVASNSVHEHFTALHELFRRLDQWGMRVKMSKCQFLCSKLKFLGHVISAEGIRPDPARSAAIRLMPAPSDIQTLRAFLGAINYYSRFVKQMREIRAPLDALLKKDAKWDWGSEQQQAFEKAKQILQSDLIITQYDPHKPIVVAADASRYGNGASISHTFSDGSEKFRNFSRMVYGRPFTLLTDHKPLLSIFGAKSGIPIYTASRLQRWALILLNYDFKIQYISTKNFGQVDSLSRLIAVQKEADDEERVIASAEINQNLGNDTEETDFVASAVDYVFHSNIEQLPISALEVAECTQHDEVLHQVSDHCRTRWPKEAASSSLAAYFVHRAKITEVQGCLLFGGRVIIPTALRRRILTYLHFTHPGVVRMKSLARRFVYWPRIDTDIERWVRDCPECALSARTPPKVPLRPWPSAGAVYERLHMDFAGPCNDGFKYLVVVDAHSKWPEVIKMNTTSPPLLITQLTWLFSRYGFPKEIVSDNGPPFRSHDFSLFCRSRGIKQSFSPPFHPQSNGQAERFVDILKRQMRKCARNDKEWLQNSLLAYRSTPSEVLQGRTPAELFLGRPIRTILSLVKPSLRPVKHCATDQHRERMAKQFNRRHSARERPFQIGDRVMFLYYHNNKRTWTPGQIIGGSGVIWRVKAPGLDVVTIRHANQMRANPIHDIPIVPAEPTLPDQANGTDQTTTQIQPTRRVRFADEQQPQPNEAQTDGEQPIRRSARTRTPTRFLSPDASKSKYDLVPIRRNDQT
uniref:RNA-directed DNA polymerase n=2 Tax=Globodera rostochiensis TaxID=31243 RepID=A0A914HTB4_GLORO